MICHHIKRSLDINGWGFGFRVWDGIYKFSQILVFDNNPTILIYTHKFDVATDALWHKVASSKLLSTTLR
jgi:hypothetical protein